MSRESNNPPRWMNWILECYCKSDLLEDLQGDLYEYYDRNLSKGPFRANLIYLIDVIKFCRLYTVRKPNILVHMTFFSLIANYIKTSLRSIKRHRLFSFINVSGLAIAMSVGLLIITYLSELLGFDTFHEKKDRIYRVNSHFQSITSDRATNLASTSVFLAQKLKEEYAGFEEMVLMRRGSRKDISKSENLITAKWLYSTNEFFDVFSFDLIAGDAKSALSEPYHLILSEKTAKKLFDEQNPVGQIVSVEGQNYTVAGVAKDAPVNSHLQFEVLASFKTIELEEAKDEHSSLYTWRSVWMNYIYFVLPENESPETIQHHLDHIASVENGKNERYSITFDLQAITDILPGPSLSNQIGASATWENVYKLLILTLIVLLSACFNYTNLSIARSLRRAKEVGIRKAVGASRSQVLTQFIFEAVIVSLMALFLAYGLFILLKDVFINLVSRGLDLSMDFEWVHLLYFVGFAVTIGLLSGLLPSLFLSKLKAISIFRDASQLKLMKGVNLRKVLIVLQFSLSMAFIMGATITYRQYVFATNFDHGFSTENVLNVEIKGNDPEILQAAFTELHEVENISFSGLLPGAGSTWTNDMKYKDPLDSVNVFINHVDSSYVRFHEFELLAGKTFPYNLNKDAEPKYIIIDEKFRKRFGFEDPHSALGEVITIPDRTKNEKLEIIGVMNEYQYTTIQSETEPSALLQAKPEDYNFMNLKVNATDVIALMDRLETAWRKVDPVHPFEALFYNERIQDVYYEYKLMYNIFSFLSFLAITIAAMGLLGMAVFTTETRMKEISIRKVMGASQSHLVLKLSKNFLIMLLVSAAIAIPATYFLFETMVLSDYVNRISIGLVEIVPGVLLILLIGWSAISWQTLKAAKTNPADMLRND